MQFDFNFVGMVDLILVLNFRILALSSLHKCNLSQFLVYVIEICVIWYGRMSKQLEKEEGEMSDIHALHVDSEEDQERLREFVCKSSHTSRMGCQL